MSVTETWFTDPPEATQIDAVVAKVVARGRTLQGEPKVTWDKSMRKHRLELRHVAKQPIQESP